MNDKKNSQRGKSFTLIELLVVVSIIALLIAILLPNMKRARDQAKSVMCMANLRSMGQAFTMYAERYNGVWPPPTDEFNTNRWPVPFHIGGIIHAKLAKFDASGKLVSGVDKSVFICPAEKADRIIPDWHPEGMSVHPVDRVEVGGSYAMNEEVHRFEGHLERGNPTKRAFINKIDNCRRPSEIYEVMDNYSPILSTSTAVWRFGRGAKENPFGSGNFIGEGTAFYKGYRLFDGSPASSIVNYKAGRIIGERHTGRGNAMAIDTHAESYRPEKVRYNQVSWERWKGEGPPPGGL